MFFRWTCKRYLIGPFLKMWYDIRYLIGQFLNTWYDIRYLIGPFLNTWYDIRYMIGPFLNTWYNIRYMIGPFLNTWYDIRYLIGRFLNPWYISTKMCQWNGPIVSIGVDTGRTNKFNRFTGCWRNSETLHIATLISAKNGQWLHLLLLLRCRTQN